MGNPGEQEQSSQTHYPSSSPEAEPVQEEVVPPPPPYSEITVSSPGRFPSATDETPVTSIPAAIVNNTSPTSQSGQSENDNANSPTQQEVHVEVDPRDAVSEEERRRTCRDKWPHETSCAFACFSSIIGIYNIGRFSLLVHLYKACFIVEFIILSLLFGIPFLCLQMAIGQYLGSGILDMWYISPAFKGIGFSLLYGYLILGVYTAVPISWLFVYFKDSFITSRETYKWGTCQGQFAQDYCLESQNKSSKDFVGWSVSSYFHGNVLDRNSSNREVGDLRFEISFNLAIVWLLVFLALSRGNRLYGKLVYAFVLVPVSLLFLVAVRIMEQWGMGIATLFDAQWKDVLTDSTSWLLAAREVFLTWILYGALCLQMCSHNKFTSNVMKNLLAVGVGVTFTLIFVSLFFASAAQALKENNLTHVPSSYENPETVQFLQPLSKYNSDVMNITPVNLVIGECLYSTFSQTTSSGYQVLRFATEIFPAALALGGVTTISSFWAICFFMMMIILGLAQQVALWNVVIESVIAMKPKLFTEWQTVITFICCNIGFLLGLPMTTNIGVFIIFFFDICIGSLWWVGSIFLIMIIAILFIRGRPYGTDRLIYVITQRQTSRVWILPIFTFLWNVVLPVVFLVLSIAFVRSGNPESDYPWQDSNTGDTYWPLWAKKLATLVQALPLLIVIVVCIYQACRYLKVSTTNEALHERVEHWCCPVFATPNVALTSLQNNVVSSSPTGGVVNVAFEDDPPPKYTPPPSYSSATARMIIKKLVRSHSMNEGKYRKALRRLSFSPTLPVTVETVSGVVTSADNCSTSSSASPPSS
ncbi:sodium- and chloride-dependent glycine transporter 1-like [Limulus polyphemus]|uniref:Sodium- and chloride-dependent glycine transporter 1-like n=1 Tax=Limulus polyphemus TaxID=6850 RepID=A0ABM1SZN0_LIMPO|nr:sodium- and chloride-dependent glycine transporter 1-like [Limulus polyphemus]XP_022249081.1 sodium- and chloride-dependent glycine transporter 1-like [Limulus polyphemus]XP_022249082.1 sodium- and chloride-dependent glycine transporter 1-like [Limulus polyphemus]XP_022249083.1 sodium- and chloride-dependent glycine transporter 1-like [Limulus polyphemus]XP_022249084.1 sodium- and chloride-dependent glycine transporter 1-like [Limulus polyphemus]XP_022249085.1 sodium- and chloride-dependent